MNEITWHDHSPRGQSYVAHVEGLSQQYGLRRTFVDESGHHKYRVQTPGVYEVVFAGAREYRMLRLMAGELKWFHIPRKRAMRIAEEMDSGLAFEAARAATAPAK